MRTQIEEVFYGLEQRTMKWSSYFQVYQDLIQPFIGSKVTIVEIGVLNGGSLHMWRRFLGDGARIIGIDNNPNAKKMESHGFEIFIGDQSSPEFWEEVFRKVGPIDILVDDGGHTNKQQIVTTEACLDHINDGGMIIVEDTHTSYMKHFGNPSKYNFVNYAKHLVDCLQSRNPLVDIERDNPYSDKVYAVCFYESIVCFRIDRRRCSHSTTVEAGTDHIDAVDFRQGVNKGLKLTDSIEAVISKVPNAGLQRFWKTASGKINGKYLQFKMTLENRSLRKYFSPKRAQS